LMDECIKNNMPDIILNFAAYTNVEDAEDVWIKNNFEANALWVYNLAKLSKQYNIKFITISTDYVFDWVKETWYSENDAPNPINSYGTAKYLWERLARQENPDSIIVRTSWLYGWGTTFKNFVNTMLKLSSTRKELKVVNDQFGAPTYTIDLCEALAQIIDHIDSYVSRILHFSNQTPDNGISRFEFAREIFRVAERKIALIPCSSSDFPSKLVRPQYSKLINWSNIHLRNRKEWLQAYLSTLS
jgi:dTDP-4-dehydrorhamnose reductase